MNLKIVNAATYLPNNKTYFFYCGEYKRFDHENDKIDKNANIGIDGWFEAPLHIDAAIRHPRNRKVYFFKEDKYYRYNLDIDRIDKEAQINVDGWNDVCIPLS